MSPLYPEIEPYDHGLLVSAWELARAWPQSELKILPHAAHSMFSPDMSAAIVAATDRFREFSQK